MLQKRWFVWLIILLGLLVLGMGVAVLLYAQVKPQVGLITGAVALVLANIWVYVGLWKWRHVPWVRVAAGVIISGDVLHLLSLIWTRFVFFDTGAVGVVFLDWKPLALTGSWYFITTFIVGLALIRLLLSVGLPAFGVARTFIDEAIRMKIALVFIAIIAIMVPVLPFVGLNEKLEYRVKTFLTYSLSGSAMILSLMTIFLACWTVSREMKDRQIYLTLTKPVSRLQYLLGKFIGLALLNLLLVAVVGVGVYFFVRLLAPPPVPGDDPDRLAEVITVHERVLVARETVRPVPPPDSDFSGFYNSRLRDLYLQNPDRYANGPFEVDRPEELARLKASLTEPQLQEVQGAVVAKWHTIAPRNSQAFRFENVGRASEYTNTVQFRFKPSSAPEPPDGKIRLVMRVNGRYLMTYPDGTPVNLELANNTFQVIPIPVNIAAEDGSMTIELANEDSLNPEATFNSSVTFAPGEGMEMLYRVGTFETNLLKSLGMIWLRLIYLSMLGLAFGTFLSFPIAALACMLIFVIASASGFLRESLTFFSPLDTKGLTWWDTILLPFRLFFTNLGEGKITDALKIPIRLLGQLAVALIPSFSDFNPVPLLAGGRVVAAELMGQALLWVGLIWTGVCAIAGWLIFRARELATATT